jgi:uncharacterized protein YciI
MEAKEKMSGKPDLDVLYVILLSKRKPFTEEVIKDHVSHLKSLDEQGKLVVCGPFTDVDGGIIIIRASSIEEARTIAESDPFFSEGFESYKLRTLQRACRENNYLLEN